jgi:hypothetical protein
METKEKIQELEKQIEELKKEEMEELFKSVLNGLKIEIDDNEPNLIFYKKNGKVVFRLYYDLINKERIYFYCDYNLVWSIFEKKYNINYYEIQEFINSMVEKYLKLS